MEPPDSPVAALFGGGVVLMVASVVLGLTLVAESSHTPTREAGAAAISVFTFLYAYRGRDRQGGVTRPAMGTSTGRSYLGLGARIASPLVLVAIVGATALGAGAGVVGGLAIAALAWPAGIQAERVWSQSAHGQRGETSTGVAGAVLAMVLLLGIPLFLAGSLARAPAGPYLTRGAVPTLQLGLAFSGYVIGAIVALATARFAAVRSTWHAKGAEIEPALRADWLRQVVRQSALAAASGVLLVGAWLGGVSAFPASLLGTGARLVVEGVAWVLSLFAIGEDVGRARVGKHIIVDHWSRQVLPVSGTGTWWLRLLMVAVLVLGTIAVLARARWVPWILRVLRSQRTRRDRATAAMSELGFLQRAAHLRRLLPGYLTPRERILHDFGALLSHAARFGIPRTTGVTAHEFASSLRPLLPDVGDELDALTTAFVEARYSRHEVEASLAGHVHRCWVTVRAALLRRGAETVANVAGK